MTEKRKRRRFQFSLRTLLLAVLLLNLAMSWFAVRMERARRQSKAISRLTELEEAWIWYDCHCDGPLEYVEIRLRGLVWLRSLLGEDFFYHVTHVDLTATKADDSTLEYLRGFPKLRTLVLDQTPVGNDGLRRLRALRNLQGLSLSGTQVGDDGLKALTGMASLRQLALPDKISDEGLSHLSGLTNLEGLTLSGPNITDAGLKHLTGLTNLNELVLSLPRVTDTGLEELKGLSSLHELWLFDTQVTPEGVEKLHRALPECAITY